MKSTLQIIASLVCAFALTACGGGGSTPATPVLDPATQPAAFLKTDTVVGTGPEVGANDTVTVRYTLWLYNSTKPNNRGTLVETSGDKLFLAVLGRGNQIQAWEQGIPGMKVGGKRTLTVPSALGYGSQELKSIPANSGLLFDIELVQVSK